MNKCTILTSLYIAPFSEGGKKIRDTLKKQSAYKLICSRLFYLLLVRSKKMKSAALYEQMHDFDLPVYSTIFRRKKKKSGIQYRHKTHIN